MERILCLFPHDIFRQRSRHSILIHQNAKYLLLSAEIRRDILGRKTGNENGLFPFEIMAV